ncbi:MAG TPA: HD domain-containing phosphohydrolase [Chthonomonadaceae bacterium]|nr:HD domain-containing phosphohydrolase [Chthonomonadaceae bacterium]
MMSISPVPDDVPASRPKVRLSLVCTQTDAILAETPAVAAPSETVSAPKPVPQTTRVLIVDDDARVRDILARILVRSRYQVRTVASAEEAMELLRCTDFDLVMSDVMLGGMSGLELTSRLKSLYPDLPIILITAHGDADLMRLALRRGACDFVPKPFHVHSVPLIIERNLERKALEEKRTRQQDEKIMYSTVQALAAAIDAKEPFTAEHSRRVTAIACALAQVLELPESEHQCLELAAQVHDVGKIGTPDYILNKPERLSEEEWQIIRYHPIQGAEIVGRVEQLACVAEVVRHHHEWYNGDGYPDKLAGEAIPLLARIISVADAYEVMTSDRVYRKRMSAEEALRGIQECSGTQFDPQAVAALTALWPSPILVSK